MNEPTTPAASDTPRTDALADDRRGCFHNECVHAEEVRKLERELNEANAARAVMRNVLDRPVAEAVELLRKHELYEEAGTLRLMRLDALEQNAGSKLLAEVENHRNDLRLAAGECLVPIPEPGTMAAKMLRANVLMRRQRDLAREELIQLRRKVSAAEVLAEAMDLAVEMCEHSADTKYSYTLTEMKRSLTTWQEVNK